MNHATPQKKHLADSAPESRADEQLLAYLAGRLNPEEQRALEAAFDQEPWLDDAVDGLARLAPDEARQSARRINRRVQNRLRKRKKRPSYRAADPQWNILLIVLVLFLMLTAWFVLFYNM